MRHAYLRCPTCGKLVDLQLAKDDTSTITVHNGMTSCDDCGEPIVYDIPSDQVVWL